MIDENPTFSTTIRHPPVKPRPKCPACDWSGKLPIAHVNAGTNTEQHFCSKLCKTYWIHKTQLEAEQKADWKAWFPVDDTEKKLAALKADYLKELQRQRRRGE
jgi:hypothetical protein